MASNTAFLCSDKLTPTQQKELAQKVKSAAETLDCKFVELEAAILQIFKKPQIVSCCGNSFCLTCIQSLESRQCPLCKVRRFEMLPDKRLERLINQRKVYCTLRDKGCTWTGELAKFSDHFKFGDSNVLSVDSRKVCLYLPVPCKYCKGYVRRLDMDSHKSQCDLWPSKCEFCSIEISQKNVETHYKFCSAGPVLCKNFECSKRLKRKDLDYHLNECPWSLVYCEYRHAGCEVRIFRKDMPNHLEKNTKKHLDLFDIKCKKLEVRETEMTARCYHLELNSDMQEREISELHMALRDCKEKVKGQGEGEISFLVVSDLAEDALFEHKVKGRFGQYGSVVYVSILPDCFRSAIVVYNCPFAYLEAIEISRRAGIKLCKQFVQVHPVYST